MLAPLAVQMSKFMSSCRCGTFLDDKKYDKAVDSNKKEIGLFQAWMDNQTSTANLKNLLPAPLLQQPRFSVVVQNIIQRVVQLLPQPIQNFVNKLLSEIQVPIANLSQFALKTGAVLENIMNKVVSFFFGDKKDKTLEKEKRQKDDLAETDLCDDFFVKESLKTSNASNGNSSH